MRNDVTSKIEEVNQFALMLQDCVEIFDYGKFGCMRMVLVFLYAP